MLQYCNNVGDTMTEIWAYYDANTIQITGDSIAFYRANQLIKIIQGGNTKWFLITSVNLASGNTRLNVSGGGAFALTNEIITYHGYIDTVPEGLPYAFDLKAKQTEFAFDHFVTIPAGTEKWIKLCSISWSAFVSLNLFVAGTNKAAVGEIQIYNGMSSQSPAICSNIHQYNDTIREVQCRGSAIWSDPIIIYVRVCADASADATFYWGFTGGCRLLSVYNSVQSSPDGTLCSGQFFSPNKETIALGNYALSVIDGKVVIGSGVATPIMPLNICQPGSGINPGLRISQGDLAGLDIYEQNGVGHVYFDNFYDNSGAFTFFRGKSLGSYVSILQLQNNGDVYLPSGSFHVGKQVVGGFGGVETYENFDWNDSTVARSGNGYYLLRGSSPNGPISTSAYYHIFNFEYGPKDGSGNLTQIAIPYLLGSGSLYDSIFYRTRYLGNWNYWRRVISEDSTGYVQISGDIYIGNNCSALSFTDRTDAFIGDALAAIEKIAATVDGKIDHNTLPEFARYLRKVPIVEKVEVEREVPILDADGNPVLDEFGNTLFEKKIVSEDQIVGAQQFQERNIGNMVSILTTAVQQLMSWIETEIQSRDAKIAAAVAERDQKIAFKDTQIAELVNRIDALNTRLTAIESGGA